jgi:23S rRNA (guanosine2251-2'-O)-methyltransferase
MTDKAIVHGWHAVRWLLQRHPERVREVWLQKERNDGRSQEIAESARRAGISVQRPDHRALDKMTEQAPHQGVAAAIVPSQSWNESQLLAHLDGLSAAPLLLLLDGVQDPHNLGACLRTADACGVHAVVVPRDRAVGLTATVRKVAAGAAETVPLVTVTNLARTMSILKERELWLVGAAQDAPQRCSGADLLGPLAVVIGGEGEGLRRLTRESCDLLVSLPMLGAVESLNVSVATGMVLHEVLRQRAAR